MIHPIERDRVRSFIMQELIKGRINVGDRLSLPTLSKKLKCSVTPVREALTQLEYSGVIKAVPNRGFIIPVLNFMEAKYLYELVSSLECLALENSTYQVNDIENIKKSQRIFEESKNSSSKILADINFHYCLIKNYQNPFLQQTIKDLKIRIFFYEKKFMNDSVLTEQSALHHNLIIESIESKNLKKAANILKQNWLITLNNIQNNFNKNN
jgi:DNA-binding GntR family transcriptional regulator